MTATTKLETCNSITYIAHTRIVLLSNGIKDLYHIYSHRTFQHRRIEVFQSTYNANIFIALFLKEILIFFSVVN